jgi:hypothetical protein
MIAIGRGHTSQPVLEVMSLGVLMMVSSRVLGGVDTVRDQFREAAAGPPREPSRSLRRTFAILAAVFLTIPVIFIGIFVQSGAAVAAGWLGQPGTVTVSSCVPWPCHGEFQPADGSASIAVTVHDATRPSTQERPAQYDHGTAYLVSTDTTLQYDGVMAAGIGIGLFACLLLLSSVLVRPALRRWSAFAGMACGVLVLVLVVALAAGGLFVTRPL